MLESTSVGIFSAETCHWYSLSSVTRALVVVRFWHGQEFTWWSNLVLVSLENYMLVAKILWFQQEMQTICGTETGWKILGRAGKGGANLFYVRGRNYKGCRGLNCNGANSPQNDKLRGERYVGNSGFKTSEIVILSAEFWPPFFVSQHRWLIRCEYQRTGRSNSCCPQLDAERNTTDEWNINVFS